MTPSRAHLADEFLRRFAAALRSGQLYSHAHPIVGRNREALAQAVEQLHLVDPSIVVGIVGDEIIVNELPIAKAETNIGLVRRLRQIGVERVTIDRGVTRDEMASLVDAVATLEPQTRDRQPVFPALAHVRVGRVTVERLPEASAADIATFRRLYRQAVGVAEAVWDSAGGRGHLDLSVARTMIDGLAQAVSQNRTALMALTTLKDYDNYTFTHMVNVSILTMGQARALGVDGPLLREFGLAALMHDIGKVRTPLEVLNKADKLTDEEFVIMKRHVVDGAEILRATPEIPTLAPVVAFEHHLRVDGSGYPAGVRRPTLNICTMLCSIADVYDAMRSQRKYQQAFPNDRILEVLKRGDGMQFDRHLVRRFAQLIGIYPVGNLVRLNTGEVAVVTAIYAPDPYRPRVKVLIDSAGVRLDPPYDVALWDANAADGAPSAIAAPVDPADTGIDPLTYL